MNTFKKEDLAWVAGFFDGEGSVTISHPQPVERPGWFGLQVRISQITKEPLTVISAMFGGTVGVRDNSGGFGTRQIYQWSLTSTKAGEFLELLLPYLIVKKADALLALEFLAVREPRRGIRLTEGEAAQRLALRTELMALHQREGLR